MNIVGQFGIIRDLVIFMMSIWYKYSQPRQDNLEELGKKKKTILLIFDPNTNPLTFDANVVI